MFHRLIRAAVARRDFKNDAMARISPTVISNADDGSGVDVPGSVTVDSSEYVGGNGSGATGGLAPATLKFTAASLNEVTSEAKPGSSNEPTSKFPTAESKLVTAVLKAVIAGVLPAYGETVP